ncbi:MAG: hypothetical protein J6M17_05395 [Ruminococcus sp.]|nr:hypothetical protein [Ruminococcus sp.]
MQRQFKQRLKIQQGIIALVSAAMMIFVIVWVINTAVTGNKNGIHPIHAKKTSASADADGSAVKKTSTKKKKAKTEDSTDTSAESSDTSLPETVIPDTTQSSGADSSSGDSSSEGDGTSSAVYDNAAMKDDFSDACFIGDSRTVGLEMNSDKAKADFFASQGLNISSALDEPAILLADGSYGTVLQGVSGKQYKRIFIMFGINELGWPSPEVFVSDYVDLVNQVKAVQPQAQIYIESVLPVSYLAANEDAVFTNENIDNFNEQYVKQVAAQTGTTYLDVNSWFKDETGALPVDAAADGIHFVREYCLKWIDLLAYLVPGGGNV